MKKSFLISLFALLLTQAVATNPPDEGMWLPMFIKDYNYADMQKLGLQLTPEQMYDINHSCLKDAIVQLGNFCTGEIISDNGLMLTNHHCGYSSIADHSTEEHDYLKNGFWAQSYEEELPNEGLTVTFLVRMEDVTAQVLANVTRETKKSERAEKVSTAIKELKEANSEGGRYTIVIKPFFEGNEYYMFVYEVYRDVRLVGAPPSSIGKFGDETDNWVWPRHTGDFSIFRIYTDQNGKPADYSPNNIPLQPKHVLPINIKGIEYGDYAMIWGFPGTTDRFMTSYEIENMLKTENAPLVEALDQILPVIRKEMNSRDIVRINYASDYASMANTWKNKKGETASLQQLKVADKKAAQEAKLLAWINEAPDRQEKYGNPMEKIEKICKENDVNAMRCFYYANMSLMLSKTAFVPYNVSGVKPAADTKSYSEDTKAKLLASYKDFMKGADPVTEMKIIEAELKLWASLPVEYQPDIFELITKKYKGSYEAFAKACVEKSLWGNEDNLSKFLNKPSLKVYEADPLVCYFRSVINIIFKNQATYADFNSKMETPRRKYLAALKEMEAGKPMYPDANSTMRCTYGTVIDYFPRDGVHYRHFTTAEGILEKEIPGDPEFDVDPKLKSLILNKDFGRYAAKDGSLPVCFLTNNDITGGNSGSPVLNASGELIGCAFDGNIEALSSNIAFDENLQRCINVDARYILFIIDKFAGAQRLIDEMHIVQ
ncbi:MAG: S46 family peptidase [Bacteroidales bacterium]|nr:S46 family peptidase [Bacteroidales bacterium]